MGNVLPIVTDKLTAYGARLNPKPNGSAYDMAQIGNTTPNLGLSIYLREMLRSRTRSQDASTQ